MGTEVVPGIHCVGIGARAARAITIELSLRLQM